MSIHDSNVRNNAQIAEKLELENEIQKLNEQLAFYKKSFKEQKAVFDEIQCLARNIYFEAGTEPISGKIAVAEVTMNRVNSKHFPKTICGVVYQKANGVCQFSWVCERSKPVVNNANWQDSMTIAENILISNKKYGIIGNATYFHANYVEPSWAQTKKFVKQIGNHLFYSESPRKPV